MIRTPIAVIAVLVAAVGCQAPEALSSPDASDVPSAPSATASSPSADASRSSAAPPPMNPRHRPEAVGDPDGAVPDGVTVFDDGYPGVAKIDSDLLQALRTAARAAADDGVKFYVNSGWRSPEYQDRLLRDAVSKYGSEAEAARWVATADTSPHVSGDAIDVGDSNATAWLSQHGTAYGLCQIYRNEPWHYELRTEAVDHGCPRMYADPTQDPRMQ
ncbi:M15 family metallopeptidase [Streptomyces sp. A7024]|uniref:M15 family metallopeptidase n=1 Tax=Streptomyces coryli TaxID=1128680 RepID=A0A6G4TYJ8_9ACTN|nr:M15 family metallopeptidase [Streptomyces coryli]NGN64071.1 M15 family metallopeptidase [Streptomyces coryli]